LNDNLIQFVSDLVDSLNLLFKHIFNSLDNYNKRIIWILDTLINVFFLNFKFLIPNPILVHEWKVFLKYILLFEWKVF